MELKNKIVEVAAALFRQRGIKSVTMDDIARQAGVSKKTIYQEFKNKSSLVFVVFSSFLERDENLLRRIFEKEEDVIKNFIQVSRFIKEQYSEMNPMILSEIKRYYPKSWKRFEDFKKGHLLKSMVALLERGKEDGYFRKELNVEIIAMLRLDQIAVDFRSSPAASRFTMMELQLQIFDHFLHGILTDKGRKTYLKETNN